MSSVLEKDIAEAPAYCAGLRKRYFAIEANKNLLVVEQLRIFLEVIKDYGEHALLVFMRNSEFGLGLNRETIARNLDLIEAHKRYPLTDEQGNAIEENELLWEALGPNMSRLVQIEDSNVRQKVVKRCRTRAQYENGFISSQVLTIIIKEVDSEYYDKHPSDRQEANNRQKDQLKEAKQEVREARKEVNTIKEEKVQEEDRASRFLKEIRKVISKLQEEDNFSEDQARRFFSKKTLEEVDSL